MNQVDFDKKPVQGIRKWMVAATLLTVGIIIGLVVASDLGWLPTGHAVPDSASVTPSSPVARPVSAEFRG
jgi:serine protease Do